MLKLPKIKQEENSKCKCRPVCKSRRRDWKGQVQKTSAELLLERKPLQECFRRKPMNISPNGPCPIFGKSKHVTIQKPNYVKPQNVVRICAAPIQDTTETSYLKFAEIAKRLGAWDSVKACCAFCKCGHCCSCNPHGYSLKEESRDKIRKDMKHFDARVKHDCKIMRIMYDVL